MVHIAWGIVLASAREEQISADSDMAFLNLGGKPVLSYSLKAFEECPEIEGVAVVIRKERMAEVQRMVKLLGFGKVRRIVAGTAQRASSLRAGLGSLDEDVSVVVIHDVSRPCVAAPLITETVKSAKRYGCGIAAVRLDDAVKTVQKGQTVSKTLDARTAWVAQTPQAFKLDLLTKALDSAAKKKIALQDESLAVELIKKEVHLVPSSVLNLRINSVEELALAEGIVRG